mmetsp:Transcript_102757/g.268219  ORF Transcript_102757/g.268219 Transcript_102757/m.268219 type:complete len:309 (-) Transcript_102757:86-1012(-)
MAPCRTQTSLHSSPPAHVHRARSSLHSSAHAHACRAGGSPPTHTQKKLPSPSDDLIPSEPALRGLPVVAAAWGQDLLGLGHAVGCHGQRDLLLWQHLRRAHAGRRAAPRAEPRAGGRGGRPRRPRRHEALGDAVDPGGEGLRDLEPSHQYGREVRAVAAEAVVRPGRPPLLEALQELADLEGPQRRQPQRDGLPVDVAGVRLRLVPGQAGDVPGLLAPRHGLEGKLQAHDLHAAVERADVAVVRGPAVQRPLRQRAQVIDVHQHRVSRAPRDGGGPAALRAVPADAPEGRRVVEVEGRVRPAGLGCSR